MTLHLAHTVKCVRHNWVWQ